MYFHVLREGVKIDLISLLAINLLISSFCFVPAAFQMKDITLSSEALSRNDAKGVINRGKRGRSSPKLNTFPAKRPQMFNFQ